MSVKIMLALDGAYFDSDSIYLLCIRSKLIVKFIEIFVQFAILFFLRKYN